MFWNVRQIPILATLLEGVPVISRPSNEMRPLVALMRLADGIRHPGDVFTGCNCVAEILNGVLQQRRLRRLLDGVHVSKHCDAMPR